MCSEGRSNTFSSHCMWYKQKARVKFGLDHGTQSLRGCWQPTLMHMLLDRIIIGKIVVPVAFANISENARWLQEKVVKIMSPKIYSKTIRIGEGMVFPDQRSVSTKWLVPPLLFYRCVDFFNIYFTRHPLLNDFNWYKNDLCKIWPRLAERKHGNNYLNDIKSILFDYLPSYSL